MGNRDRQNQEVVIQRSAGAVRSRYTRPSPLSWVLSGGFFALLGLCGIVIACVMISNQRAFLARANPATATIVGGDWKNADHNGHQSAVFTFRDGKGKTWRVIAPPDVHASKYDVGEHVDAFYTPSDPAQAEFAGFDNLWSLWVFLIAMSSVIGGAGVATLVVGWRGMRQAG